MYYNMVIFLSFHNRDKQLFKSTAKLYVQETVCYTMRCFDISFFKLFSEKYWTAVKWMSRECRNFNGIAVCWRLWMEELRDMSKQHYEPWLHFLSHERTRANGQSHGRDGHPGSDILYWSWLCTRATMSCCPARNI